MFCLFRYKCCGATAELQRSGCSPRYSCCLREVDRLGCRKVCKKCGRDWGSPALDCFRKDHELVDINLPPTASPTTAATSQASSPPTEEDSLLSRPPSVAGGLSGQLKPSYRHSAPHSSSSFLPNITYHIIWRTTTRNVVLALSNCSPFICSLSGPFKVSRYFKLPGPLLFIYYAFINAISWRFSMEQFENSDSAVSKSFAFDNHHFTSFTMINQSIVFQYLHEISI